jgi:hypothetical protein
MASSKEREKPAHNIETKSAKLERLCSVRLIHRDSKATNSRHANVSSEIMDSSLLAPTTNHFKQVISQVKLINNTNRLATYAKHTW